MVSSKVISHSLPPLLFGPKHHLPFLVGNPYHHHHHHGHQHVETRQPVVSHGLPFLRYPHSEVISHGLPSLSLSKSPDPAHTAPSADHANHDQLDLPVVLPGDSDHLVLPADYDPHSLPADDDHDAQPGHHGNLAISTLHDNDALTGEHDNNLGLPADDRLTTPDHLAVLGVHDHHDPPGDHPPRLPSHPNTNGVPILQYIEDPYISENYVSIHQM